MQRILQHQLWIGNYSDLRDYRRLYGLEIQAIVDLAAAELPAQPPREFLYFRIPLYDGEGNSSQSLRLAVETVSNLVHYAVPAIVGCSAGMSRSPAVVSFALAQLFKRTPQEYLLQIIAQQPHDVSPTLWNELTRAMSKDS